MKSSNSNSKGKSGNRAIRGKQGRKDSNVKRENFDNVRVSKFKKDLKSTDVDGPDYAKSGKANDLSWYTRTPSLLQGSSRLTFAEVVGTRYSQSSMQTVPGVMRLGYCPAISFDATTALQQSGNSIYSFTVHANSRSKSYDQTDEMLLILAGAQVFSTIALGIRAYGIMQLFDERNVYLPKALVQAAGFNYNDLKDNYSHMWFDLNQRIVQSRQIWVPDVMPLIKRWFWLNSNIYMDGDSVKSQYYMFTPDVLMYYSETANDNGGGLISFNADQWGKNKVVTWSEYLNLLDTQLNALMNSQDRGIIFGDILKAYGSEHIFSVNEVALDYKCTPVYDAEVLTQIENATLCTMTPKAIYQNVNSLMLYMEYTSFTAADLAAWAGAPPMQSILNFHQKEVPTEGQVMIATRLKTHSIYVRGVSGSGASATYDVAPAYAGTETLSSVQSIRRTGYTANGNPVDTWTSLQLNYMQNLSLENFKLTMQMWSAYDWCPWAYEVSPVLAANVSQGAVIGTSIVTSYGDWDNYTIISDTELRRMHNTAIYSEFGVPVDM